MLRPFTTLALGSLAFALTSCKEIDPATALVSRDLPVGETEFRLVETSTERFRYQSRPAASAGAPSSGPRLVYTTPEGWAEAAAASMRDVNLSFGPNQEGECYVSRLPGPGGGLEANVNRWRKQFGAEPLTLEQIEALPTKPLFGQPATFVQVDGPFTPGMGSTETKENYRLLGLILSSDAGAVFVKMTGPQVLVEEQTAGFDLFTGSLDVSAP
jgi:hypothetical protein